MGWATPKVKDGTPFRYTHAEIRTQVVVICGTTCYQLDCGGNLRCIWILSKRIRYVLFLNSLRRENIKLDWLNVVQKKQPIKACYTFPTSKVSHSLRECGQNIRKILLSSFDLSIFFIKLVCVFQIVSIKIKNQIMEWFLK